MKLFTNFLKIYVIATICSLVPFLYLGLIFGAPAVLLSSILITLLFRKELGN